MTTMPGITVSEIKQLTPNQKNPSARVSMMVASGEIRREGRKHYIGDGVPPIPAKLQMKAPTKLSSTVEELRAKNAELVEWIRRAIEKYPDLAVPDVVIEARKIVVEYYQGVKDFTMAGKAKCGDLDQSPIMQVTIMAMEKA